MPHAPLLVVHRSSLLLFVRLNTINWTVSDLIWIINMLRKSGATRATPPPPPEKKRSRGFSVLLGHFTDRKRLCLDAYWAWSDLVNSIVATRIMLSNFWNALNYLRLTLNTPWDWPLKVTKVKCNHTIGLPIYDFLLRYTSNFTTYTGKPSKSQSPWLWPYKVNQGEMWWRCWTLHMWFSVGV